MNVGDKVIFSWNGNRKVETVTSVTPSGRFTVAGTTFNADGSERGRVSAWHFKRVTLWTQETEDEIKAETKKAILSRELSEIRWRDLPLSVLEKVDAVLDEAK